jgi:hypothetical protein
MGKIDLFILESLWDDKLISETSVRPFFEGLSRIHNFNYIYHTFYDEKDLRYFVKKSKKQKLACSNYYIATHSTRTNIIGRKEKINIDDLRKIFEDFEGKGIYFGTCSFGNFKNSEELLNATKADWIAGYSRPVDWFNSTIIDVTFWHNYFLCKEENRYAWDIANYLYEEYPISLSLKFSVFDKIKYKRGVNNSLQEFKEKQASEK